MIIGCTNLISVNALNSGRVHIDKMKIIQMIQKKRLTVMPLVKAQ